MVVDGSKYERELERRLWNEGWASFRVAGSGTVNHPSADVVALKKNRALVFEVKSCVEKNLPLGVRDDREQLMELEARAEGAGGHEESFGEGVDVMAVFAIRVKNDDAWYVYPGWANSIPPKRGLTGMYKLLMDGYEVVSRWGEVNE